MKNVAVKSFQLCSIARVMAMVVFLIFGFILLKEIVNEGSNRKRQTSLNIGKLKYKELYGNKSVSVLERINSFMEYVENKQITESHEQEYKNGTTQSNYQEEHSEKIFHMIVVACGSMKTISGRKQFKQLTGLIKSAIIMTQEKINFHLIVDSDEFYNRIAKLVNSMLDLYKDKVIMTKHEAWYPKEIQAFKAIYRPCSTQRLLIPDMFPDLNQIVYVDTDVLFLRPPEHLFQLFEQFNKDQFISMDVNMYPWKWVVPKDVPIYKNGFNSGVMLMDVQKTRRPEVNWQKRVKEIDEKYKGQLHFFDQDLMGVFFNTTPENIYDLPCHWNTKRINCIFVDSERCPLEKLNEVSLVHGTGNLFFGNFMMKLRITYETFMNFDMSTQLPHELPLVLEKNIKKKIESGRSACSRIKGFDDMILKWPKATLAI